MISHNLAFLERCLLLQQREERLSYIVIPVPSTFFVRQYEDAHDPDQDIFENWEVVEDDGHHAQITQRALGPTQNVFPVEPQLARGIQPSIIYPIVVSLG